MRCSTTALHRSGRPAVPQVHLDRRDRVAVITLSDTQRRNALSLELCEQLVALTSELTADEDVGALVVTGADPAFCAGADLSQLGASRSDGLRAIYEGFLAIARCPLPTVAAVNGAAVGAGMNLALACDLRLAGRSARFDDRFLDLGIHPGGGHTWMLRRIVGPQATAAAVLFGEVLDGPAAERIGLVWRCVADDELLDTAVALARRAAEAPRDLAVRTKATLADVAQIEHHSEAVERELVDQLWSMDQPAFAERLAAFQARITGSSS
ncbi:MAG: enoyl-CoA hydratase [Actinobacteria bacterium]|nr:enoyl-CoA hydratase [Actinomycetota bacterium]